MRKFLEVALPFPGEYLFPSLLSILSKNSDIVVFALQHPTIQPGTTTPNEKPTNVRMAIIYARIRRVPGSSRTINIPQP